MYKPLTIKKAKKLRDRDRFYQLSFSISGNILEISTRQILSNNKQYVVVELADDSDYATIQIWGSDQEHNKVDYILNVFEKGDTITIIEPRKPNSIWLKKKIDFWVNEQLPPIGTDLSGLMEWYSNIKTNTDNFIFQKQYSGNKNIINQSNNPEKPTLELTTADKLLESISASQNKIDQELVGQSKRKDQLHFNYSDYEFTINKISKDMISPVEWCTIWIMKNTIKSNKIFTGQASIYGKLSEGTNWEKILHIKAFTPSSYAILKENIETFYDMYAIKNLNQ